MTDNADKEILPPETLIVETIAGTAQIVEVPVKKPVDHEERAFEIVHKPTGINIGRITLDKQRRQYFLEGVNGQAKLGVNFLRLVVDFMEVMTEELAG